MEAQIGSIASTQGSECRSAHYKGKAPAGREPVLSLLLAKPDLASNTSHQHQDDHDNQDQSQPAAGVVPPGAAVRPRGQRPNQQKDQNDNQNCEHWLAPSRPADRPVLRESTDDF